jgi:Fe2+ or Zn2+ uptake regulation protein
MPYAEKIYLTKLKSAGLSSTQPRYLLYELLSSRDHQPMSVRDVIAALCPRVDRASVYRALKAFEQAGIIQRVSSGWKYKVELSDDFHGHHHHLICKRCGRITPVDDHDSLESTLEQVSRKYAFSMQDHQLEIKGICADCKRQN